jgi:hypothetical protein
MGIVLPATRELAGPPNSLYTILLARSMVCNPLKESHYLPLRTRTVAISGTIALDGLIDRGQRENGVVRCDQGPGHMLWEITRN